MMVRESVTAPPAFQHSYTARMEGPDKGLVNAWLAGLAKRREILGAPHMHAAPTLVDRAKLGELPVLPYRGGVEKAIKRLDKVGALHYVAMWHGLRGEDLELDTDREITMKCSRTGVPVLFTIETKKLLGGAETDESEE